MAKIARECSSFSKMDMFREYMGHEQVRQFHMISLLFYVLGLLSSYAFPSGERVSFSSYFKQKPPDSCTREIRSTVAIKICPTVM